MAPGECAADVIKEGKYTMHLSRLVASIAVCTVIALPSVARNDRYTFPLQPTLDSPNFAQQVGTSVKFTFGDQSAPAGDRIGDYVSNERQHFHGKTEEGACRDTLLSALADMRDRAARLGGNAVVGVVSYFRKVTFSSPTDFECHAGSNGVFVSLMGTIVKLK
jgi:uncharacterized protein YbjQ (UPF0145 family)